MLSPAKILIGATALATTTLGAFGVYKLTEEKNVRDVLTKKGKNILDTDSENDVSQTQEQWTKITSRSDLISGLKAFLGIKDSEVVNLNDKISDLKKKCKETLEIERNHEDFQSAVKNAESYCVQEADK